jgi:hypothetical protein
VELVPASVDARVPSAFTASFLFQSRRDGLVYQFLQRRRQIQLILGGFAIPPNRAPPAEATSSLTTYCISGISTLTLQRISRVLQPNRRNTDAVTITIRS